VVNQATDKLRVQLANEMETPQLEHGEVLDAEETAPARRGKAKTTS
jgi:hypothetical protein